MGGNAFQHASAPGEPTLHTPRMSKQTYDRLRNIYRERLLDAFPDGSVETLVEAPGKETYGDLDFVVARNDPVDWDWQQIADSIGARGFIRLSRHKCTLAVPADGSKYASQATPYMPVHDNQSKTTVKETAHTPAAVVPLKREASSTPTEENLSQHDLDSPLATAEEYAHIDIEVVSREMYEWYMFYASYGDLAGLLGHIVRHQGFTITDKGLFLRHKSLDDSKSLTYVNVPDKEGMLHLSHNPDRVMQFLGLPAECYRQGFKTIDELYAWLGKCRLLSPQAIIRKRDRSNDRQKDKRAIFSNFLNFWLPEHHPDWVEIRDADMKQVGENADRRAPEPTQDSVSPGLGRAETDTSSNATALAEPAALIGAPRNNHILPKPINLPDSVLKRRAELASEAADFFDKRPDFEAMDGNIKQKVGNATAGELLKDMLRPVTGKSDKGLNEIVRAFRRQVAVDNEYKVGLSEVPHADEESELYKLMSDDGKSFKFKVAVKTFAEERWEEIRELERRRAKAAKENSGAAAM